MKEREISMSDKDKTEVELMKACVDAEGKDHRFVSFNKSFPLVQLCPDSHSVSDQFPTLPLLIITIFSLCYVSV